VIRRTFIRGGAAAASLAILASALAIAPATAHSPDPLLGTTAWGKNQIVSFQWAPGAVPPSWAADEIEAGAEDVAQSRDSKAALFRRVSSSSSRIAYGGAVPCSSYGIACMNRSGVPDDFAGMWFRPHLSWLDWGQLKWCQALLTFVNGCYDVENVALDEFGHIEMLGHHVNYDDDSDFEDAVVQYAARSRPKDGWNQHVFGRCDVARLQVEYSLENASTRVSSCLNLVSTLAISVGGTQVGSGDPVRITGTLRIASASSAGELSGDPLSGRVISLQRRALGGSAWGTVGTMSSNSADGSYGLTITPSKTYDYRLVFTAPSSEGLTNATSSTVRIGVVACAAIAGKGAKTYAACA
jgi:hypothetical protein